MRGRMILTAWLVAACASAEFSAQEKTEVKKQFDALRRAANSMQYAVLHARDFPQDVGKVADYLNAASSAWRQHTQGLLWLLDQNGWDTNGQNLILVTPRAEMIVLGKNRIATPGYANSRVILNTVTASGSNLTTAKSEMDAAISLRSQFNTALEYLEPRLAVNLAQPAATREKSATAGPHGSYRMIGFEVATWARDHANAWKGLADAIRANPAWLPGSSNGAGFYSGHLKNGSRRHGLTLGVSVGVEGDEYAPRIETMFQGGTTPRGREFFQILAMMEGLINWTHTPLLEPDVDVNGDEFLRGYTYDLTIMCSRMASDLKDASLYVGAAEKDFAFGVLDTINSLCSEWGNIDDLSYQGGLALKFFQVFPPPPAPCDPATTVFDPVSRMCVGTGGGSGCSSGETCQPPCPECPVQISCGAGTSLVGTVCVADPCPQFQPEMILTSPVTAEARCNQTQQ